MAYTKETIFSKIGELLVEINDDYTTLSDKSMAASDEVLLLLEAKAIYLTSHIEILRKLVATVGQESASVNEERSTSSFALEGEIDTQPVHDEIQEVIEKEGRQPEEADTPIHEMQTDVAPLAEDPSDIADDKEEPLAPSIQSTPIEKEEQPHLVVEESRPVQEEVKPEQAPAEDAQPEVVVNEVVEEPKQIILDESLNIPNVEEEKPVRPLTLNEILQQQRKTGVVDSNITSGVDKDKIVDLKSSISLNDKLLFIKDLFNGYSLAYSEAIELLNRYVTFAEADAFLQTNYALKNNWADKPQTVEKLYAILRKKFML